MKILYSITLALGLLTTAAQAEPVKAGDLTIDTPWLRATPNGAKVAGGYVRITNTGTAPDTLTGAAVPFAKSSDIHSMSMEGGVMKMAPVSDGLTIKPGETVELKPGGYHLMFEGLTGSPKAGETVSGTLSFRRAGAVPVTFSVAPIGASAPGGPHQHQHQH
ncbi:copper chaperone PCu(A)C [Methylobacterium sp. NEAU K]|uniref:copper chaperone PCu(A)C n=1 Tax=Methylobacterium sp. NEAU K TaxID=3064946 RepID=UPI00351EAD89